MCDEDLYLIALKAITNLFGDTSVSPETTRENLAALIEEIEMLIDTL